MHQDSLQFCMDVLMHVPEKGFVMVRHYGFYHQKCTDKLDGLNESLGKAGRRHRNRHQRKNDKREEPHRSSYRRLCITTFGRDPVKCRCGTTMQWQSGSLPRKNSFKSRERAVFRLFNRMKESESPRSRRPDQPTLFEQPMLC